MSSVVKCELPSGGARCMRAFACAPAQLGASMPKARGRAGAGRRKSHLGLFDDLQPMLSVVDKRSADALEVLPLGPPRLLAHTRSWLGALRHARQFLILINGGHRAAMVLQSRPSGNRGLSRLHHRWHPWSLRGRGQRTSRRASLGRRACLRRLCRLLWHGSPTRRTTCTRTTLALLPRQRRSHDGTTSGTSRDRGVRDGR